MARRLPKGTEKKPEPAVGITHMAYAEAAIMVLECLMLKLIERRVLTAGEMINMVEDALATKRQMVDEGEHIYISSVASGVLSTMANSLRAAHKVRRRQR